MSTRRAVGVLGLIVYGLLGIGFCLTREGAVPMLVTFGAPAVPILVFWWWRARADARRETHAAAELARTMAEPIHFVLHELTITLPSDAAARLASEMDRGSMLAHRTAAALAAAGVGARLQHTFTSYEDASALREAVERAHLDAPSRGYRGGTAPRDDAGEGAVREVVWTLGVAYAELPGRRPASSDELPPWLDALVPAIPERTLISEVRVRTPSSAA